MSERPLRERITRTLQRGPAKPHVLAYMLVELDRDVERELERMRADGLVERAGRGIWRLEPGAGEDLDVRGRA